MEQNHRRGITLADIEDLNLKDLRAIGRAVGVYAPTALSREDLLRVIMEISDGRAKPAVRSSRGRPHKGLPPQHELIERILASASERRTLEVAESIPEFEVDSVIFRFSVKAEGLAEVSGEGGVLHLDPFRADAGDPILPPALIERYDIRTGDHLLVLMRKVEGDRYHSVQKILEINGHASEQQVRRPRFEDLQAGPLNRTFPLEQSSDPLIGEIGHTSPLPKGCLGTLRLPGQTGSAFFKPLFETLTADGSSVLALLDLPEEEASALNGPRSECLSAAGITAEERAHALNMLTARARRGVESGLDVVVLAALPEVEALPEELCRSAKAPEGKGSLTVLLLTSGEIGQKAAWQVSLSARPDGSLCREN